jgi:tetratricopeptide (TPR) repeat protein
MNDRDKAFARLALQRNRLSIGQVEQIRAEVEKSGRSFRDVAVGCGLLSTTDLLPPAPREMPTVYFVLLACSLVIFAGLLIASALQIGERSKKDDALAVATSKNMAEADRKSAEARRAYQRSLIETREARAREALARARAAKALADEKLRKEVGSPEAAPHLNEAFSQYNTYLDILPDDAAVRVERADIHELRRNYDRAIDDLERAIELKRELEPALKDRIIQLRLLLPRKPQ